MLLIQQLLGHQQVALPLRQHHQHIAIALNGSAVTCFAAFSPFPALGNQVRTVMRVLGQCWRRADRCGQNACRNPQAEEEFKASCNNELIPAFFAASLQGRPIAKARRDQWHRCGCPGGWPVVCPVADQAGTTSKKPMQPRSEI